MVAPPVPRRLILGSSERSGLRTRRSTFPCSPVGFILYILSILSSTRTFLIARPAETFETG